MKIGKQWGAILIVLGGMLLAWGGVKWFVHANAASIGQQVKEVVGLFQGSTVGDIHLGSGNEVTETKTLTADTATHPKLVLNNSVGKVTITGDSTAKEMTVQYTKSVRAFNTADGQSKLQKLDVSITATDDAQQLTASYNGGPFTDNTHVDMLITLPPNVALDLQGNVNEVVTRNMNSPITVKTNVGKVDINGFKDTLTVQNQTGAITVRGGHGIKLVDVHTNVGAINLVLPANTNVKVDASTNVGGLNSAFPLTINKTMTGSSASGEIGNGHNGRVSLGTQTGAISLEKE